MFTVNVSDKVVADALERFSNEYANSASYEYDSKKTYDAIFNSGRFRDTFATSLSSILADTLDRTTADSMVQNREFMIALAQMSAAIASVYFGTGYKMGTASQTEVTK